MDASIEHDIYAQGFCIIDNFLSTEDYLELYNIAEQIYTNGQYKSAKIGHRYDAQHHKAIRRDQIHWIDEDSSITAINHYFVNIRSIAQRLNQALFLGLLDFEAHFAVYSPGDFYRMHVDQFSTTKERRISCVYYLNKTWQTSFAGELKLYNQKDALIACVEPQGNRFICFSSDLPHEVCETNQTRYSIAGWMKTRALS